MKYLFLFCITFPAVASTTITFSKDGQRASVSMTSMSNNPDAIRLFETLTQAPVNFGGRSSKRMSFADDSGTKALDINCLVSDAHKQLGNCVVVFYSSQNVNLRPAASQVQMIVRANEAARLAKEFNGAYQSDDGKLKIQAHTSGEVELVYH